MGRSSAIIKGRLMDLFYGNNLALKIKWFEDRPSTKTPECICSLCELQIDEYIPIRIVNPETNLEARFHKKCYFDNHTKLNLPVENKPVHLT